MTTVLARYSTLRLMDHFRVPRDLNLRVNDMVVLKTKRGLELGQVKLAPGDHKLRPDQIIAGEVLRKPSLEDSTKFREYRTEDFRPVKRKFKELAAKHKLPMRYQNSERLLSGDKLIVYFTAEDRLDFREFVREFTESVGQRVELRQVGARDAARVAGDVGVCGQELCCISYIIDFVPVSMKMAKTQHISLDPQKISGQCGRLKCCLKYEDDLYNALRRSVPLEGQPVTCEGKECHACSVDILGQKVIVDFGDGRREPRPVSEITFEPDWSDKDIRRYKRERREKFLAERAARDAARSERMKSVQDRRHGQDAVHPARRADDKPTLDPEAEDAPDSGTSAAYEPVDETAAIARDEARIVPPDTAMIERPVIEAEPEPKPGDDATPPDAAPPET
ncbi:MAG: hypothetical protein HS108_13655 [Planctomycetes bacterium]|jgi:cell fate regulator YaaT (PSP1 superfamily)|nr:hypothetical protein [Planctomycetota bacterium]